VKLHRTLLVLLFAAACQPNTVSHAYARLETSPAALDFGQRDVGSSSSLGLTLTNSGNRTITSLAVSLEAGTRPVFSLSAPPATLEAGASVTLNLTYLPAEEGADGVTIHLSSDADDPDVRIAVAARAVRPSATPDAGADAGAPDAGEPDSGLPDAAVPDSGAADAGPADAGRDGGFTWDGGNSTCPGASDVRDLSWLPDGGRPGAYPIVSWTGSQLAVTWTNSAGPLDVDLTFLAPDGTPTGVTRPISPVDNIFSALANHAWTGSGFGVAYVDARTSPHGLYFTRANASGVAIGTDHSIPQAYRPYLDHPNVAWNPLDSEYGVAWFEADSINGSIYSVGFNRLDQTGAPAGLSGTAPVLEPSITVANGLAAVVYLVSNATGYDARVAVFQP